MKADEKKCPQCAEIIKADARICRHCGHQFSDEEVAMASKKASRKSIGCAVLAVMVLGVGYCASRIPTPQAGNSIEENSSASAPATSDSKWEYSTDSDKMRGTSEQHATLASDNKADFSFPYSGGSTLQFDIRKRSKDGLQVMLTISKGQFVCHSFTGGHVSIKFDNGPIKRFGCTDTSDGDTSTIFLGSPAALVKDLRASKTAMVESEFFQEGSHQFTFSTAGLNWK